DVVISNADLLQTYRRMLGAENVDPDLLAELQALRPTQPCFLTHVGLKGIPTETLRTVTGYHWASWDPDEVALRSFKLFVPTLYEPAMAPPGGHIVIVQKLTDINYHAMEDWAAHKAAVEQYVLTNLERL